jgi:hypothetical protein
MTPSISVDFMNKDEQGRIRLNTVGTIDDLAKTGLVLTEGLRVLLVEDGDDYPVCAHAIVINRNGEWLAVVS